MVHFFVSAVLISKCYGGVQQYKELNETISDDDVLSREKRFLVFPPTTSPSIIKYIGGYLGPIVSSMSDFEKYYLMVLFYF